MKQYFLFILFIAVSLSCSAQQQTFRIKGTGIKGLEKGVEVSVIKSEQDDKPSSISAEDIELGLVDFSQPQESGEVAKVTVTKAGEFVLEGTINHPQLCTLITNNLSMIQKKNKEGDFTGIRWTYTPIFLSNSDMEVGVAKYDLWGDEPISDSFKVTGGQAQNDFNEYNLMLKQAGKENNDFSPPYEQDMKFIESHPSSVVSLYLANRILTNGYNLSKEQIKHLEETMKPCPEDTARYNKFLAKSKMAELTAVGNPIVDLDLEDVDGKALQLVNVVPKTKLALVDFWASWCGICRASTPEIKELYKEFPRDVFDVISVSCDTHPENWKKAMEADKMPWKQYVLTKQGYDDFFAKYQLKGVPYYLLVNSDGKVIGNPGNISHIKEVIKQYCSSNKE